MSTIYAYAPITKSVRDDDGNLVVYGMATGPQLDGDGQICDPGWLKTAMPEWFETGANIREMHRPSAVGVGTELEQVGDDHWVTAKVVEPNAIKLTDEGVYQGFSIGVKSPKIVKDANAPGGRIVGGKIVEVSLVDRPCNGSAKLVLAKMVGADLVPVDQLAKDDGTGDMGGGDESAEKDWIAEARTALSQWLVQEATEVAAGTGSAFIVQLVLQVLSDLDWAAEADAYDDVTAALDAVKTTLTTGPEEAPVDLTKLASATEGAAPADILKALGLTDTDEVRKALGVDRDTLRTEISEAVAEATTSLEETIKGLGADVAKVLESEVKAGPVRTRPPADTAKSQAIDAARRSADEYDSLARKVASSDPKLAEGYLRLAAEQRAEITKLATV